MPFQIAAFLVNQYYFFLKIIFLFWALFLFFNLERISLKFKEINRKTWLLLFLIILSGVGLRMWLIPHTHHVYFDEFEHINIAQNMLYHGEFFVTLQGSARACQVHTMQFWPPGYHAILSFLFALFGDHEYVAYFLSVIIGTLSIGAVFFLSYRMFKNNRVALCTTFLFNLIPVHLKYSGASETSICSLFFILLTLIAFFNYVDFFDLPSLIFAFLTMVVAIYMRPENGILLFLMVFLVLFFGNKKIKNNRRIFIHIGLSVLLLLLLIPYFLQLYVGLFITPPPGWNENLNLYYILLNLKKHLPDNLKFWISNAHPLSYTVLSAFGLYLLFKKQKKEVVFFLIWFVVFLLLFSQYHIGNFLLGCDSDRYSLNLYIPVVLFAGFGLFQLIDFFKTHGASRIEGHCSYRQSRCGCRCVFLWPQTYKIIVCFILGYIVFDVSAPLKLGLNKTFSRDVYQEYQFVLKNKDVIPDDIFVIACEPAELIAAIHKKAITPDLFIKLETMPEKAILFKDFWWFQNNDPELCQYLDYLRQIYDFELLSSCPTSNENSFLLIELKKKPDLKPVL